MPRSVKDFERYKVSATDGDLGSVAAFLREDTFWTDVEELSRHYAWLPGWAGCDRSIPSTPLRTLNRSAAIARRPACRRSAVRRTSCAW
jgi:hypothetical protein